MVWIGFAHTIIEFKEFVMRSKQIVVFSILLLTIFVGCDQKESKAPPDKASPDKSTSPPDPASPTSDSSGSLDEARKGFKTTIARRSRPDAAPDKPPAGVFNIVKYDSPAGALSAYVSPDPKDGKKHPAIVWITGGDCNRIDKGCWTEGAADDEQSASAYRKAGILMMFPALRGGNNNPGVKEGFFGEVDDVIAAGEYLRKQPFVDPDRVYLGGHSTGGTLVLLTAECKNPFRAIFSFGPADDVRHYPDDFKPFATRNPKENQLRSPVFWLKAIRTPTFVFEGTREGNLAALRSMAKASKNPKVQFLAINGATHFSALSQTNRIIAEKLLKDTDAECNLSFTEEEVSKPFKR